MTPPAPMSDEAIAALDEQNARDVAKLRTDLHRAVSGALDEVANARHALELLTSNLVYDVDLAEGGTGIDVGTFLAAAGRNLRAADALTPAAEGGAR